MSEKIIDISKVIENTNLPASTLRYYEQKGLIQPVGRKGLRRQYGIKVLERLALIYPFYLNMHVSVGIKNAFSKALTVSNGCSITCNQ